ncbi:uncharacterized protein [Bemisia tabaci]|uniref:uncharacterized protein n=1 Tax=Bemisia tabaci TaxID=7038 RepID=UPI003B27B52F
MVKAKKKSKAKAKVRKVVKRPKFMYKASDTQDAMDSVRGAADGIRMSCKAAAKKFKVPRSTLQRKLKDSGSAEDREVGPEAVLGRTNEETLVQWALHLSQTTETEGQTETEQKQKQKTEEQKQKEKRTNEAEGKRSRKGCTKKETEIKTTSSIIYRIKF